MKLIKYTLMLMAQFTGMLILAYLVANTLWLSRFVYNVCLWAALPAACLMSAYMVTVRGVNNYIAWILPPLAVLLAHYLAFFYMPSSAGPFFICAFTAIVGAAAGDVKRKMISK